MTRNFIIAGNWKMNGSQESIRELVDGIKTGINDLNASNLTWLVFPPSLYLSEVATLAKDSPIEYGAQNICTEIKGAFTGEIAAPMLKDYAAKYVLIGHSERRHVYGEDDQTCAQKFLRAIEANLTPILCVGETLDERNSGNAQTVVKKQIDAILNLENGIKMLDKAIIAYEPVWAIGTGITATPDQAQEMHAMIREYLRQFDVLIAEKVNILYGGSLKPANAKEILAMPDINGGLIGGASLKADSFVEIGKIASEI